MKEKKKFRLNFYIFLLLFCVLFFYSATSVEVDLFKLLRNWRFMANYLVGMFPPNFEGDFVKKVFSQTLQTIELAFVATVIATVLSFPFAFLGARNVMRSKGARVVSAVTRFALNSNRAIDALIVALFFVSAVGLGPFAGTLALAVHSVGMLGKMFFEAVEAIDKGPVEALESAGASKLQVLRWAVLPQALPHFLSHALFRFELNIRGAVVLGLVGAGGIGFLLNEQMRLFQYQNVSTVLLTILILVMTIDAVSGYLRRKLM